MSETASLPKTQTIPPAVEQEQVPRAMIAAMVSLCAAAWLAAGSMGLLGHSLRHALTWVFLGLATVAAWPGAAPMIWRVAGVVGIILVTFITTPSILPVVNVSGVAVVAAILAYLARGIDARVLRTAAGAILIFAVFRFTQHSMPLMWSLSDVIGAALGRAAGWLTRQPLAVGTTYGGVDFLVLALATAGLWIAQSPWPRGERAAWSIGAIIAAQIAYLAILSFAPSWLKHIPEATRDLTNPEWAVAVPFLVDGTLKLDAVAWRQAIPWMMPILCGVFQAVVIVGIVRRTTLSPITKPAKFVPWVLAGAAACALLLPILGTWCTPAKSLEGKKFVVSKKLFGNYLYPKHGEYGHLSIGMYGNLKPFIESLGGSCTVASEDNRHEMTTTDYLSDADLREADVLIVIYPNKPFIHEGVDRALKLADNVLTHGSSRRAIQKLFIDRIWKFVENGGTLLLMGEHTIHDDGVPASLGGNYMNELLQPSAIRVAFDSATFEVGGWLQTYHTLTHPITSGVEDSRNQFGHVIGASLEIEHPARPILIGKHGYNDPGDRGAGAAMMGNHKLDPGERLGDVVLAAEQAYGKGRVLVFGDTSAITNGITVGAHPFNSRLLAYCAHNPEKDKGVGDSPQGVFRQMLGMLLAIGLVGMLTWRPDARVIGGCAIVLAASLAFVTSRVAGAAEFFPDYKKIRSERAKVAYIDNSHLGYYSEESWRNEGTMGLAMNLMRCGYMTYMAPDLRPQRLEGANLVVIPAPTRAMSEKTRADLVKWVRDGGKLVLTVGWDRYAPNRELLHDFGFKIEGPPGSSGPEPLGHFKSPYRDFGDYRAYVRFNAAWLVQPLVKNDPRVIPLAFGRGDEPVILARFMGPDDAPGRGIVILVGDSEFATNKNLEREGGQPFEGMRENADFWRWLVSFMDHPYESEKWYVPPNPAKSLPPPSPTPTPTPIPTPDPTPEPTPRRVTADDFELEDKKQ